ncbi:hypothetical protein ACFV2X_01770 [Streptomyces sp. NPDC059679]
MGTASRPGDTAMDRDATPYPFCYADRDFSWPTMAVGLTMWSKSFALI